jgi:hypothetical protein
VTTTTRSPEPPRPRGHPILGALHELRADTIGFLTRAHAAHGDHIRFRVGPQTLDSAIHPDHLKEVLVDRHGDFVMCIETASRSWRRSSSSPPPWAATDSNSTPPRAWNSTPA